jgi:hypothetical protein
MPRKNWLGLLLPLLLILASAGLRGNEPEYPSRPRVLEMAVPAYPPLCKIARIEGQVDFIVQTDGTKISKVVTSQGPPMLVRALGKFLETWRFESHAPIQFGITFKMKVSPESVCPPGRPDEIKLILPTHIEMTGYPTKECDPVTTTVVLTSRSSRTPPALPSALSQHFAISAPLIASAQAWPLSFIR